MDVVTFGETMVLFAAAEQGPLRFANTYTRHTAGTESNFAIGLARLGHQVGWFSRVGDDEFGQYIVNTVRGEGVDTSRVIVDAEAPTGVLFKEKRELGARKIVYYRRGSAASRLAPGDLDRDYIASARYLHLTGITPALSATARSAALLALRCAQRAGTLVCLDVNYRARLWTADEASRVLRTWIPYVDVLIASDDELPLCLPLDSDAVGAGAAGTEAGAGTAAGADPVTDPVSDPLAAQARQLLDLGVGEVVVKLGADGARAFTPGGSLDRREIRTCRRLRRGGRCLRRRLPLGAARRRGAGRAPGASRDHRRVRGGLPR